MEYIKNLFSIIVLLLLILCSFFVSYDSSMSVFNMLDIPEIKGNAHVISWFSGSFASVIPLVLFIFNSITIRFMMKYFFDTHIYISDIFFSVSIGYIAILLYQYFLWYNLIMYSPTILTGNIEDYFEEIDFLFNLTYKEVLAIGDMCFLLYFPITILTLYKSCCCELFKITMAVCIPPLVLALCYSII